MAKETFADRLKLAMNRQGLKQVDLIRAASLAGVKLGKSHVSQYVSGKTVPRADILRFLAKTLQVDEGWLKGSRSGEGSKQQNNSGGSFPADGRNAAGETAAAGGEVDAGKATAGNTACVQTAAEKGAAGKSAAGKASAEEATANFEQKKSKGNVGGITMRQFKKSSKLNNVLYDVRGPVVDEAARMEEDGTQILKLNIGNPAPFGFHTPDEVIYDMRRQLTECEGYSPAQGLFSARKAIMQYAQLKKIPNVTMDDIYTGNGVSELINLCMSALLDDGDEILIPAPDYPLWTACATLAGGKAVH